MQEGGVKLNHFARRIRRASADLLDSFLRPPSRLGIFSQRGTLQIEKAHTAETAVRRIKGVRGVSSLIQLKPRAQPSEIKRKIQDAFERSAEVDANQITVEANGGEVVLKGTVRSWVGREEAERAAWAAPGVTKVEHRIVVSR